jgi:phosphoribosylformylglycinamidine cyclo-ligase
MYQVFNMGHRMELYVAPRYADKIIAIAERFGVAAKVIGRVEASEEARVTVKSKFGVFEFN